MPFGLPDTVVSSELDAVNLVMFAKGLDQVTSIDLNDAEIAGAAFLLNAVDIEVQSKGWFFNKDYALELALDASSEIPLPEGVLGVSSSYWNYGCKTIAERGGKLWDLYNKTSVFSVPVTVDITVRQAFTDLPQVARTYIATLAAHRAQGLDRGVATSAQFTSQMVLQALALLEQAQDEATPANQVHSNISVQGAINGWGGIARTRTT